VKVYAHDKIEGEQRRENVRKVSAKAAHVRLHAASSMHHRHCSCMQESGETRRMLNSRSSVA
jgi:hypothetical protein